MTPPTLRLIGAGPLTARIATLLLVDPTVRRVFLAAPPAAGAAVPSRGVPPTTADLARRLGRGAPPGGADRVRALSHWTKPDDVEPSVSVIVSATVEPDRAMTDRLTRTGGSHLLVVLDGSSARIGPLVVPGVTSCLGCADRIRRDHRPDWPRRLLDATRVPVSRAEPLLLEWTAAQTALQTLAVLRLGYADVTERSIELDLADPLTRIRHWPRHPDCGCRQRAGSAIRTGWT